VRILQNTVEALVAGVSFERHGQRLVAGGSGGFDVWDLPSGKKTFSTRSTWTKYIYACICDPLGRWFYFSDSLGGCRLFDLAGPGVRRLPGDPYNHHVISLDVTPDGRWLVVSRGGAGVNHLECWRIAPDGEFSPAWALRNGQVIPIPQSAIFEREMNSFIPAMACAPDGATVAVIEREPNAAWTDRPRLMLRALASGERLADLGPIAPGIGFRMTFTPNGRQLLGWDDHRLAVWDTTRQSDPTPIPHPGRAYFRDLAIHPSGQVFVTVAYDGQARIWDIATHKQIRAYRWPISKLHSVAFSPDGTLAVAGGDRGQLVAWDVDL
jgi:WD40 repeat protein